MVTVTEETNSFKT